MAPFTVGAMAKPKLLDRCRLPFGLAVGCAIGWLAIAPGIAAADPPNNDSFENPRVVPPGIGSNNSSYTAQPGEPAHAGVAANHSIWFRYTNSTTEDQTVRADSCGSDTDTVLSAYEAAPNFASLVSLGEDDDSGAGSGDPGCTAGDSMVTFTAAAGTSYLFALDSKVAASPGSFAFVVKVRPPNADFADAIPITGTPASASATNFLAGAEAGEPAHAGQPASNSVWYSVTAAGNGTITIDGCESQFDTVLAVYTGTALNALTPVASNDDSAGCGFTGTSSRVEFPVAAGQTYMVAVDGKTASDKGTIRLQFEAPPQNDMFANALDLGSDTAREDGAAAANAGAEPGEPAILGDPAEHSTWYRWTAPQSGPVRIDTCTSGFDTVLAVYTGTSLGTIDEVASDDDGAALPGCSAGSSLVAFDATEGEEYRIAIDGKANAAGIAHIRLLAKPLNDDFADARQLNGTADFGSGHTTLAGDEAGEPQHGGVGTGTSLWFSWTAPVGGIVELTTCSSDVDPVLAVYTGSSVNALTQVASNNDAGGTNCSAEDSALSFGATAGTTYRIAVDAVSGAGLVEVNLVRPEDTTAPDTSITGGPSGVVTASTAAFTYSGSPGFDVASFECSLDGSAFESCPASGTSFGPLSLGGHTFAVRAVDFDGNVDPTPASRPFTVSEPPADCSAAEGALARAQAKLKRAKAKVKEAEGRKALAKAKAKVKKAKARVKKTKGALAACEV